MKNFKQLILFILTIAFLSLHACKNDPKPSEGNTEVIGNDTLRLLDSLIQLDPRNSVLYYDRATYYRGSGNLPKAMADIYSALHIDSSKVNYYLFGGELFLEMGEGVKAAALMSKGINMNPSNEELYLKAVEYNLYLQNYESALNFANDLIEINKYNADAYFLKGLIYKEIKKTDKAISTFQTCIEVDPTFYNAHMQLGLLYSSQSDDLALQYFENALSLDENSREAYYAIAYHYQEKEDYNKAVKAYKTMVSKNPKDHEIFFNLGHCYIGLDSLDKAYNHFDMAVKIHPQYAGAYYMKGNVSESQGKYFDALYNYEQALKMLPGDERILTAIERVKQGG